MMAKDGLPIRLRSYKGRGANDKALRRFVEGDRDFAISATHSLSVQAFSRRSYTIHAMVEQMQVEHPQGSVLGG